MATPSKQGMFGLAGFGPFASAGGVVDEKPMSGLSELLEAYKSPRGNWADVASVLGGALMDLDGTMGAGNMKAANARFQDFRDRDQAEFQAAQQKKIVEAAASGDEFALALMDPLGNRAYKTGRADRKEDLGRQDEAIKRDENWRLKQFLHEKGIADQAQSNWESEFEENKRQFGVGVELEREGLEQSALKALLSAQGDAVTDEGALRKEFLGQNKDFLDVQRAIQKIRGLDTTTAPGQMGLVFNIMKMYDPGSTVREGEYATAKNTTGVPGQILNTYNSLIGGEFLTDDQISNFLATADGLYDAAEQDFGRTFQTYRGAIAPGYGFDLDRTIPDLRDPELALGSFKTAAGMRIPADAVRELGSNPTPQEMAEFNATFGPGMAEQVFERLGIQPQEQVTPR